MGDRTYRRSRPRRATTLRPPTALTIAGIVLAGVGVGCGIAAFSIDHAPASAPLAPVSAVATAPPAAAVATPRPAAAVATVRPVAVPPSRGVLAGAWRVTEANRLVGTIMWSGSGRLESTGTMLLQLHKVAVDGQPATSCELETTLRANIATRVSDQTVPFRETNCRGEDMTGDVHIARAAADGRSFNGTFSMAGTVLGPFTARRQLGQ